MAKISFSDYLYLWRYSLAKKGALSRYKEALDFQQLSADEMEHRQWLKTKRILDLAYDKTIWYHDSFKAVGLHPNDISKPEYYSQVPVLHREDIIHHFDKFVVKGTKASQLNYITTGGSSGTPLKLGVDKNRVREIQKWQMFHWWHTPLNANMASAYRGLPVKGLKKLVLAAVNWPQQVVRLDATDLTEEKIKTFIAHYKRVQPKLFHGYVGAVDAIADYIIAHNISFSFTPNAIWLTAAPVTKIQETKISKAFNNAPICDQYGCSEMYFIAAESPAKNGLHVFSDTVKLEVVDNDNQPLPNGKVGKFVLTNLDEMRFPLIRYANGDQGRYLDNTNDTGLNLPRIDKVKGRLSDNLVLRDGTLLSGEYLTTIFDDYTDYVKQFQIIQNKKGDIILNVCLFKDGDFDVIKQFISKEFDKRIEGKAHFEMRLVPEIQPVNGKLKFIIRED